MKFTPCVSVILRCILLSFIFSMQNPLQICELLSDYERYNTRAIAYLPFVYLEIWDVAIYYYLLIYYRRHYKG